MDVSILLMTYEVLAKPMKRDMTSIVVACVMTFFCEEMTNGNDDIL